MDNNIYYKHTNIYIDMNDTSRDISSWKCRNVLFWQISTWQEQAQNRKT